jgi:hypothetical protein
MSSNPTVDKSVAKRKLEQIVEQIQGERLYLTCGKHQYVAAVKRGAVLPPEPRGCADCWRAYLFTVHACTPPGQRQEHLDELESVIRHAVEFSEKGQFGKDFELYEPGDPRFQITIDKDAE